MKLLNLQAVNDVITLILVITNLAMMLFLSFIIISIKGWLVVKAILTNLFKGYLIANLSVNLFMIDSVFLSILTVYPKVISSSDMIKQLSLIKYCFNQKLYLVTLNFNLLELSENSFNF